MSQRNVVQLPAVNAVASAVKLGPPGVLVGTSVGSTGSGMATVRGNTCATVAARAMMGSYAFGLDGGPVTSASAFSGKSTCVPGVTRCVVPNAVTSASPSIVATDMLV